MKVAELRKELEQYPDDWDIVMSKDGEGNGYSPLSQADESMYLAERTWYGEVYMTNEQIEESIANGGIYGDEDRPPEDAVRVICLWPVN